jgi:hypothetical protein
MNGLEEPIMPDEMPSFALRVRKQSSDQTSSSVASPLDPNPNDRLDRQGLFVSRRLPFRHLSPQLKSDRVVARLPPWHLQMPGGTP